MNKYILLLFAVISLSARAQLVEFEPNTPVRASEINTNFNYIKTLMQEKSILLDFELFQSGSVIDSDNFEVEFNKVRNYGVAVDILNSSIIKSQELNQAFSQMALVSTNLINCSILNGVGIQYLISGLDYSSCSVLNCNEGYELSSNGEHCQNIWPNGTEDLVVAIGETLNISAGDLLNYNNVTINGTLNIQATASDAITVIGVKGNLILNGTIVGRGNLQGTHSVSRTLPNGDNLSYNITQASAGAGGSDSGGSCGNAGTLGYGGGGTGGASWASGGSCGMNNGSGGQGGTSATAGGVGGAGGFTNGHGLAGASSAAGGAGGAGGGSGGGGGGASNRADRLYMGGGGGGGGMKGSHGLNLFLSVKGTISGSGSIQLNGTNGFNGGAGGNCNVGGGYGGGGGGGGAGGSGGKLWIRSYTSILPFSTNVTRGLGGSGAAGGCRSATSPAGSGANGSHGVVGSVEYLGNP